MKTGGFEDFFLPATFFAVLLDLTPQPLFLVGGSVRDLMTGKKVARDIDLLMPSGSENVARLFADKIGGSFFFLDEERRISRVVKQTDRGDIQFDFTNFEGVDLSADLGRRDFTINAMALDLREFVATQAVGGLIDPCHGRDDLAAGLIRAVKPDVLDADPLRLLRAVRFAATLGFAIEDGTAEAIRQRAKLLAGPSPERLRDEFFLILGERTAGRHLLLLDSLGLLAQILPELEPLRGFAPGMYRAHDILTHSIKTAGYLDEVLDDLPRLAPDHAPVILSHLEAYLEQHVTRTAALRFACLLHDMAKPEMITEQDGRIRFHGHDTVGADMAASVCRRLRLSRDTEKTVTAVIRQHMRLFNLSSSGGPSRNALYRYCRDLGDAVPESLLLAQADSRATYEIMPKEKFADTERPATAVFNYYYGKFLKTEAGPLVSGDDLIRLGFRPGPRFREILDDVRERQADGMLPDRERALDYLKNLR